MKLGEPSRVQQHVSVALSRRIPTQKTVGDVVAHCSLHPKQNAVASDSRLREPGFVSCAAVLKPWACFSTLHCSSSLSCIYDIWL